MGNKTSGQEVTKEVEDKYSITPEQANALLRAFTKKGSHGKPINLKKFKKVLEEVNKDYPSPMFQGLAAELTFRYFDHDNDGKITLEDFMTGVAILTAGDNKQKAELVFKSIDRNGDGHITRKELETFLHKTVDMAKKLSREEKKAEGMSRGHRLAHRIANKAHESRLVEDLVNECFKEDTNGDGKLTLEEWVQIADKGTVSSILNPADLLGEEVRAFDKI